ncbi:MAG: hypothetical protein AAGG46_04855, partial [Planctomycetota bacterium]
AAGAEGLVLFDPVTTYNNGMPLATTDPARDADLYNGCDRRHVGCCGGGYNCPWKQTVWNPKRCWATCIEKRPMLDDTTPGVAVATVVPTSAYNGLEDAHFERLGVAPNVAPLAPEGGAQPASPLSNLLRQ